MRLTLRNIGWMLFLAGLLVGVTTAVQAESMRSRFNRAEGAYKNLMKAPSRQQYRQHWLRVIEKFEAIHQQDPQRAWAPASLYRAGLIWLEMSRFSGRKADRETGIVRLQTVATRFPQSAYRAKAQTTLRQQGVAGRQTRAPKNNAAARKLYTTAESCRRRLLKTPRRTKHRDVWMTCIAKYEAAYKAGPRGPSAAQSLLRSGELYLALGYYSGRDADREKGQKFLRQVVDDFPDSSASKEARRRLGMPPTAKTASKSTAVARKARPASVNPPAPSSSPASVANGKKVNDLRFWSNPNYTRVVIDADGKVPFFHKLLKKDPDLKKPQRLYVDLRNARLANDFPGVVPINDNLLIDARAGQYNKDTVRVVMDIKSFESYKIFSLMNPFRIVIDVWGHQSSASKAKSNATAAVNVPRNKIPPGSLTRSLSLGVSRIVIDAGHGGKDPGAFGYYRSAREKDITLTIAKKLAKKVKSQLGCEVILTRRNDQFLTLEERTALANTKNADLFISIHVNAHRNKRAYGTETYFLNLATDEESIRVAAMENATSTKNISDLQTILMDLMQNAKINESSRLASFVQGHMVRHLGKKYSHVKDKGVKQAPFYVLLGAQMPAILVETAFISNPRECKRLMDPRFQERLCDGIVSGIKKYIHETSPTAFRPASLQGRQGG